MFRIGGVLADAFMIKIAGLYSEAVNEKMKIQMLEGNFELLEMMHHLSSGQKAHYLLMAHEDTDTLRMCCGGAGYSAWSLFPEMVGAVAQMPTVEGDTVVMAAQNSRALFKKIGTGKNQGFFQYLDSLDSICNLVSGAKTIEQFKDLDHLETALKVRAAYWVKKIAAEAA
jgi:hypothetical protein